MSKKKDPKTATITIRWNRGPDGGFLATSAVNPYLEVWGSTRHRALSAIQREVPRYLQWVEELDRKLERKREITNVTTSLPSLHTPGEKREIKEK